MALTHKQKQFVMAYLKSFNATQAAKDAGYSPRTAYSIGAENLTKPAIQRALRNALMDAPTPERVLQEIARIALVDVRKFYDGAGKLRPLKDLDDDTAAAIASLEVLEQYDSVDGDTVSTGQLKKLRTWDKLRANELLGKHHRLWSDRLELTGKDGAPLQVAIVPQLAEALQRAYDPVEKEGTNGHITYSTH